MGSWRIQCGMACFVDDQRMVVISRKCYVIQKTYFCYRMDENQGEGGLSFEEWPIWRMTKNYVNLALPNSLFSQRLVPVLKGLNI